jgi:hypothetical protein
MRPRFIFTVLILVIVVLAVVFWLRPTKHATTPPNQTVHLSNGTPAKPAAPSAHPPAANSNVTANNPTSPKPFSVAGFAKRRQEVVQQYNEKHNAPIEFYGQVIDQNSNGIPGVNIIASIQQPHASLSPTYDIIISNTVVRLHEKTGEDGRFQIEGETGEDVNLESVKKVGCQLSPKAPRNFGQSSGSIENPVVIQMWKLGKAQTLLSHYLSRIAVPVDNRPVQFDLIAGTEVPSGGQLVVRVERNPQVLPPGHSGYDWSAEFEVPNGGLIPSRDSFMYEAPENGYHDSFSIEMPKDATNWTSTLNQNFYIELDNGKYFGNLSVHLLTFHSPPPIVLTLGVTINPNGSRSLQP